MAAVEEPVSCSSMATSGELSLEEGQGGGGGGAQLPRGGAPAGTGPDKEQDSGKQLAATAASLGALGQGWACLLYTRALGPYLSNRDMLHLSCTCKELRGFTEQVWELRSWSEAVARAVGEGRLRCLTRIRVQHKRLGLQGATLLADSSRRGGLRGLTTLSLCNTGLGVQGAKVLASGVLCECPVLQHLVLGYNGLGDGGAMAVAQALLLQQQQRAAGGSGGVGQLRSVAIVYNQVGPQGVQALMASLGPVGVQSLNLSGNSLGSEGAAVVAEALQGGGGGSVVLRGMLRGLDLSNNDVGSEGFHALALALRPSATPSEGGAAGVSVPLAVLRLGSNRGGCAGVRALAEHGLPLSLATLSLHDNHIGRTGALALEAAARRCPQLRSLDLARNHIPASTLASLQHTLRARCPHLLELHLKGNLLPDDDDWDDGGEGLGGDDEEDDDDEEEEQEEA